MHFPRTKHRKPEYFCSFSFILACVVYLVNPVLCTPDRAAFIEVRPDDSKRSRDEGVMSTVEIVGAFVRSGAIKEARGKLQHVHLLDDSEDTRFAKLSKDWIGVIYFDNGGGTSCEDSSLKNCSNVIDKVKEAFLFGASAIIILSLNKKLLEELDVGQLFSGPVIQIDNEDNITSFLEIITRKISAFIEITFNTSFYNRQYFTTIALWGMCGRYSGKTYVEWDGVVCLGKTDSDEGLADPGHFWNFFYSGLLSLMMLYVMKSRMRNDTWEHGDNDVEGSLRRISKEALSVMKTIKYKDLDSTGAHDVCAVCLDQFHPKQKLRVLPCCHQFHTKCVDRWLIQSCTCPMCKLNVIETVLGRKF